MIHLRVLDDSAGAQWDDVVRRFPESTAYHTWAWMQVVERLDHAGRLPCGIYDGNDLVGVLPLWRIRRGLVTKLASPFGPTGYGGPLVDSALRPAVLRELDKLAQELRADIVEFRLSSEWDPNALADGHYALEELRTQIVPLYKDQERMWRGLQRRCRKAIRKARAKGVEIVEPSDYGFLDEYYAMSVDTFAKSGRIPSYDARDYQTALDILEPYDALKVLLAKHDGQIIAGLMVLCYADTLYGWDGVAFRAHYDLCANNLLHWAMMEWGAEHGLTRYDLMGSNIPSIARFKESFGGESRTFVYAHKETSLRAILGRPVYEWIAPRIQRAQYWLRTAATQSGHSGSSDQR